MYIYMVSFQMKIWKHKPIFLVPFTILLIVQMEVGLFVCLLIKKQMEVICLQTD
jgi:hypothetical protein